MNLRESLKRHRGKLAVATVAIVLAAWYAVMHRGDLNREALVAYGKGLPAGWFMAAFLVLPLVGFPISVFLLLAGVRFGLGGGMAVCAAGILFHHVAAFRLTHGLFRERLRRRLESAGHAAPSIRPGHRAWLTALFAALHGPPYIAKLYLWALTDVPFRIYLGVGAPVYIGFCLLPVGAGSAVMNWNPAWIYGLVAVSAVFVAAGFWLKGKFGGRLLE